MANGLINIVDELQSLIPAMEDGREIHLDWAQWLEKHPERLVHEPGLGDVKHHKYQVQVYENRIRIIKEAIAILVTSA